MSEVHVVERAGFFDGNWPQGFLPIAAHAAGPFLDRALARGRFVDRREAEATPAWKQWIPYCLLRCGAAGGPDPAGRGLFVVRRSGGQSETRLHGSWSIGLGGHVEPDDAQSGFAAGADGTAFFAAALRRELAEELDLRRLDLPRPRLVGLVNDDRTEVGRVHAGLVYVVDLGLPLHLAAEQVGIREISKMNGGFTSLVEFFELWQNPNQFESWSRLLVRAGIAVPMGDCPADTGCDQDE